MRTYGVAIRKGGQGKSTTVSTVARLSALYGARVLVVDLAQPGTATASLRDIWGDQEAGALSRVVLSLRDVQGDAAVPVDLAHQALEAEQLPALLASQPSWSGGYIGVLPWDEWLADAAYYLQSERVLADLLAGLDAHYDVVLIDFPAEGGPLLTNALAATQRVIVPLTAEIPALEGLDPMLRLMARARAAGHQVDLGGILLTRCDPRNKRLGEIALAISHAGQVEGELIGSKLFPFAVRANEFYDQAFRFGQPVWERTANPSHWAPYVLLTEWLLADAGLDALLGARRGASLLPPGTRVLDTTALLLPEPEIALTAFERAHPRRTSSAAITPSGL